MYWVNWTSPVFSELSACSNLRSVRPRKRSTYACILESAASPAERRTVTDQFAGDRSIAEESVDSKEVANVTREAAASRNGWKVIYPTVRQ